MYKSMYQECLDTEILTAGPVKLVQLMYRGALDAIAGARAAIAAGDIATRSRLISKASAILNELALSLDRSQCPALCENLVELYDYMLRLLIQANVNQVDAPLAEVQSLLSGILDAWQQGARAEENELPGSDAPAYASAAVYASEPVEYRQLSYAY